MSEEKEFAMPDEKESIYRQFKRPEAHPPVHLNLTEDQKRAIIDYVAKTGLQPEIALVVDVVEGKIAPAAVSVGAA
jgi:hypothetical protein